MVLMEGNQESTALVYVLRCSPTPDMSELETVLKLNIYNFHFDIVVMSRDLDDIVIARASLHVCMNL